MMFRSLKGRLSEADLLFKLSLIMLCIGMLGCQSSAPAGAENPIWNKFSEKRAHVPRSESNQALVVHVNRADKLVTIRNGAALPQNFLLAYSPRQDFKAVLMMQPVRNTQLRTALILEGTVSINDQIVAASETDREKFSKKFPN